MTLRVLTPLWTSQRTFSAQHALGNLFSYLETYPRLTIVNILGIYYLSEITCAACGRTGTAGKANIEGRLVLFHISGNPSVSLIEIELPVVA